MSRFTVINESVRWPSLLLATVLAAVLVSALAGCGVGEGSDAPAPSPARHDLPLGQVRLTEAALRHLEIRPVAQADVAPLAWVPGKVAIRDDRVSELTAPVAGRIVGLHANIGDLVKAGAALATMASPDAARIRSEHANSRVELEVAQAEFERQRIMLEKEIGIRAEYDLARAKVKQAGNEVARAAHAASFLGRDGADQVVLRSPRDGTVIARNVALGAAVDAGSEPLFTVGEAAALWVVAEVFETDMIGMRPGAPVQVRVATIGEALAGRVMRVGSVVHDQTRRAPVYIAIDQPHPRLRAGMLARVGIELERNGGMSVPLTAVLIKDGQSALVYVQKQPGLFEARAVTLGTPAHGMVPVLHGLAAEESVVVKGALLLDGAASQLL